MADEAPWTRRNVLKAGGLLAGTLLAGCAARSDGATSSPGTPTSGEQSTPDSGTATGTPADTSYTVEMEPMGAVSFDAPPERWMAYFSTYADMGVALGQASTLKGLYITSNYPTQFYDELGLDVDLSDVTAMKGDGGPNKEAFYAVDADVHLMDPNMLTAWFGWQQSDIEEITNNVGPFVGNMIRRRGDDWHDYTYYTLYEAFEKVSQVFQQPERFDAWRSLHDSVLTDVQSRLPAEGDRPEIALLSVNSDFEKGSFWGYTFDRSAGKKQYSDLGVRDGFADLDQQGSFKIDYEKLLEIDPDALMFHFGISHSTPEEFEQKMQQMREDPVGKELTAVKNDRLFRGGTAYQGPIINLFQTELAAQQLYPDEFGEENLFDRQRVADIVNGNL